MRIAGAQSAEQSGIRGVKRPFDPNIMTLAYEQRNVVRVMEISRVDDDRIFDRG